MGDVFLSASVPEIDRGNFHESANPFLIQFAVRELLTVCLGRKTIVWGGHPSITPMIWSVCEDLGVQYAKCVVLYLSTHFKDHFTAENSRFDNVVFVEASKRGRVESLARMRATMFTRDYDAGVFIGGMEGVVEEHKLFASASPKANIIAVGSTGGAARQLAIEIGQKTDRLDYAQMFYEQLNISPNQPRLNLLPGNH